MTAKKTQLTIFMVLGVILVILFMLGLSLYNQSLKMTDEHITIRLNEEVPLFKNVIENCVSITGKDVLQRLGIQGRINPETFFTYLETNVYKTSDTIISLQELENELSEIIQETIQPCIEEVIKATEKKGFKITKGESSITTSIDHSALNILINQPITLALRDQKREADIFSHTFPVRLQQLWNASGKAVQTYSTTPKLINLTYLDSLDFTTTIIPYEEGMNLFVFEDNTSNLAGQNYMYSIAVG